MCTGYVNKEQRIKNKKARSGRRRGARSEAGSGGLVEQRRPLGVLCQSFALFKVFAVQFWCVHPRSLWTVRLDVV